MTIKLNRLTFTAIVVCLICSSLPLAGGAQPVIEPPGPGLPPPLLMGQLNLTPDQEALFRQTLFPDRESRAGLRELHKQLQQLAHSDYFTTTEAQTLVQAIAEKVAEQALARAKAENFFYLSLDSEQKATFAGLQELSLQELSLQELLPRGPKVIRARGGLRPIPFNSEVFEYWP